MKTTYKSLYPNVTLQHNLTINALEGQIVIEEQVYRNENVYGVPKYSRSGEFIENMICDNHIEFCNRWFHLANVKEMLNDLNEYCSIYIPNFSSDGQFETYAVKDNKMIISPLEYVEEAVNPFDYNPHGTNPIFYFGDRPTVEREGVK